MTLASGGDLDAGQMSATAVLAADARTGRVPLDGLAARVAAVRAAGAPPGVWAVLVGCALMCLAMGLAFGVPYWTILLSTVLGLGTAVVMGSLVPVPRAGYVLPFFAALVGTLATCGVATLLGVEAFSLFALVVPVVVLIPGAAITAGTLEISGGDPISGTGRLVGGLLTWALLAAGILLGVAAVGAHVDGHTLVMAGGWTPRTSSAGGARRRRRGRGGWRRWSSGCCWGCLPS